jgi:hypothetical protein
MDAGLRPLILIEALKGERVPPAVHQKLHYRKQPCPSGEAIAPRFGYLLRSRIASVVVSMTDGETAEVRMIDLEGVVGAIHLLGSSRPDELLYSIGRNSSENSHAGLSAFLQRVIGTQRTTVTV